MKAGEIWLQVAVMDVAEGTRHQLSLETLFTHEMILDSYALAVLWLTRVCVPREMNRQAEMR